jgi:hypothetical protein
MKKYIFLLWVFAATMATAQTIVKNPLEAKYGSFDVLGDSYSTFYGYTDPTGNNQWFPHLGVTKLGQTWWKLLEAETSMALEQNNSYSGACICNTSWNGVIDTQASFVGRCSNLRKAGLIIVEGATNDNNAGSPVGNYVYADWTAADLKTLRGGTAYVLSYLQNKYPDAQLVFMLNSGLNDNTNSSVETICSHYNVPLFKISGITKEDEHPTISGMLGIRDQLVTFLNNLNGWYTLTRDKTYSKSADMENANVYMKLSLKKDQWQALCLPVDMSAEMISQAFGSQAKVAVYSSVDGTTMKFALTDKITAGVPFLLKPSADVSQPVCMSNVTLHQSTAQTQGNGDYSFVGTYRQSPVLVSNKTKMLLDGDGSLYHPQDVMETVKSLGAYFARPAGAEMNIVIEGEEARQSQTPTADLFVPQQHLALHAPAKPLITSDPYLSVWSATDTLFASTTKHWSGNDKSITGYIRVDGQPYRFLGKASTQLDISNVILPSAYWTQTQQYTVPCMVFKKTTSGTTADVQGVPPTDSNGRNWFDSDYELTSGTQSWENHTSPFSSDATTLGFSAYQWTTSDVSADIYFRRTFTVDKALDDGVYLACGHDDAPSEIYINGTLINIPHNHSNTWDNAEIIRLSDAERALIKTDGTENVIAVHVHNNWGGAFADCGLYGTKSNNENIFAAVDSEDVETSVLSARQISSDFSATQTYYTFETGPVDLSVVFSAPQMVTDLTAFSTPINFISYKVTSRDGAQHKVQVYLAASPQLATRDGSEITTTSRIRNNGLLLAETGTTAQSMTSGVQQDWGYSYLAADPNVNQSIGITAGQQQVFKHDLGQTTDAAGFTMLGYDDDQNSIYMNGYKYAAYWTTQYGSLADAFADYAARYNDIMERLRAFDKTIYDDASEAGGSHYAELCALAYRQTVAGSKLAVNNDGRPLLYSIDNSVTNEINNIDISYAEAPLFCTYNPQLAIALVASTYDYIKVTGFKSTYGNAPHHLGLYPMIGSYGLDNGADTSSSLVIMAAAAAKAAGNADGISDDLYQQLKDWTDFCDLFTQSAYANNFLVEGSCDTYGGVGINNNANLRAKCTLAMQAMAEIAKMKNMTTDANNYTALASKWQADWLSRYTSGDHYAQGTGIDWGQKYNLFYDQLFGSGLFSNVIKAEMTYYKNQQMNTYGVPMDGRWGTVSKIQETLMTAAMADSDTDFSLFVDPCYNYVNAATAGSVLADTYNCVDGTALQGFGRPVTGMFWARRLLKKIRTDATGIVQPAMVTTPSDGRIFLPSGQYAGRRLQGLPKGIYICNGRKIVVK